MSKSQKLWESLNSHNSHNSLALASCSVGLAILLQGQLQKESWKIYSEQYYRPFFITLCSGCKKADLGDKSNFWQKAKLSILQLAIDLKSTFMMHQKN